jgi:hypothetical protein
MDAKRVTQNMGILVESYRQKAGKIGKITEAWLDELFEAVASALIKQDPAAVLRSDGTTAAAFSCPTNFA